MNINQLLEKLQFKTYWKVFVFNIIAIFCLVILQKMDLQPPAFLNAVSSIISPMPAKVDIFKAIQPKLEQKPNDYQLNQPTSLIPSVLASGEYDQANSYAVIDYDSGDIIASKNLDQSTPIASLTKIMTAVVALDLASPSAQFTVSEKAASQIPTKIGVVPGEKMTLEELLNAALLTSANDAVAVIKEGVDNQYGEPVLIKAMNAKAKFLGLDETHFTNPQGFDNTEHFSSAQDLAVLTHYALQNYPLISQIVSKDYQFIEANSFHKQFDLYNWNGLIGVYPGAFGVKIGNTEQAQTTTVVGAEREGKKVLVVLLGAPSIKERDLWASQLLDLGFQSKYNLPPVNVTEQQFKAKYASWKYFQ